MINLKEQLLNESKINGYEIDIIKMRNITDLLQTNEQIIESAATGPYTIAWGGGSIGQNDNDMPKWQFKGANYRLRNLDWCFKSEKEAKEAISNGHDWLKGCIPYKMPWDKCEIWTVVSDDKNLMKDYNKEFNRKYSGGYYRYTYGVVSVNGVVCH